MVTVSNYQLSYLYLIQHPGTFTYIISKMQACIFNGSIIFF